MDLILIEKSELKTLIRDAVAEALTIHELKLQPEVSEQKTELMTRKEVRKLFGVSLPTLISWSKQNILPCFHFKRSVRYKKSDVDRLLKSKTKHGGKA